jgi:hypothetical protein
MGKVGRAAPGSGELSLIEVLDLLELLDLPDPLEVPDLLDLLDLLGVEINPVYCVEIIARFEANRR